MVFICGGLGIILHLAWLACLFFIMDEQSVPVHSVPVSDTVHLHLPVPELSDTATTMQSTDALVQDHDSDVPQRAQCIVKRFQKRCSTHPSYPSIGAVRFASECGCFPAGCGYVHFRYGVG